MLQVLFAFLAGVLTIAAPCILPLLPILLGTSIGSRNKSRPLLIVSGFIVSFAAASMFLSLLVGHLGLQPSTIRNLAIFFLTIFAAFLIWPRPFELLTARFSSVFNSAGRINTGDGNTSALLLGLTLGVLWTPCAGPVLGVILTLIATQGNTGKSATLLVSYALGAGLPMLIIAYAGQYLTTKIRWVAKFSVRLQQIFGLLILALAIAMYFQYDVKIQTQLTKYFPINNLESKLVASNNYDNKSKTTNMDIDLKDYGPAPEFTGISQWLNSNPLTIKNLRGKVVLIDFWTYSCINCIRTLPFVTKWYDTYKDKGFVIVGVHTPEFAFEKLTENVQTAIKRFKINYPVAQDNDFGTWNAYSNQFWPAEYLINKEGNIVYTHFGEGNYDKTENAIRLLLGMEMEQEAKTANLGNIKSPEMYFGTNRLEYLTRDQLASHSPKSYSLPADLKLNTFALEGTWQFEGEKTVLVSASGKIRLKFSSGKVFMVADAPGKNIALKITVDGVRQNDVIVGMSQLYTLFDSKDYREHTIEIEVPENGFEAFTFTFG